MNHNVPALLLGMDNLIGLQISRFLWKSGVPVIGIAEDHRSHHAKTRSVVRMIPSTELINDPFRFLEEITGEFDARPVLIPCRDEYVWWLSDYQEKIQDHAYFLLPPSDVLMRLSDKVQFYTWAMENQLPIPTTHFIHNFEELDRAEKELSFPVVIKPPRHTVEWMLATGGHKVFKADDAETLRDLAEKYLKVAGVFILQTWIEGPDANMHSFFSCLDRQGNTLTSCVIAKKLRQWPPDIGVGALSMQVHIEEVENTALELLRKVGYIGPSSVQFKQDEVSKKFYIIEVNTRPPLNFGIFESCGVEMSKSLYCEAAGLPLPENRTITRPGGKWISWNKDLASAYAHWKRGDLNIKEYFASLRGHKYSADIRREDLRPFLSFIGHKITGRAHPE
jgi:predicted ATP-grasp superfamily ATP-dependent carboligase